MKLDEISMVGRPLDFDYPSNRAIAFATLLTAAAGFLFQWLSGVGWSPSFLWGLQAGLTVFLAWALCRELDPDRPAAATVAAGLALAALAFWGLPQLSVIFWLLILVRMVNRSPGLPATLLDSLSLVALGVWLSLQGDLSFGLITALALFLDGQLPRPARRQLILAAASVVVTAVIGLYVGGFRRSESLSPTAGAAALVTSLAFLPVIRASRSLTSVGDRTGERLIPVRVQAAQALVLLTGLETALLRGPGAIVALAPLWAAVLGASLSYCFTAVGSATRSS